MGPSTAGSPSTSGLASVILKPIPSATWRFLGSFSYSYSCEYFYAIGQSRVIDLFAVSSTLSCSLRRVMTLASGGKKLKATGSRKGNSSCNIVRILSSSLHGASCHPLLLVDRRPSAVWKAHWSGLALERPWDVILARVIFHFDEKDLLAKQGNGARDLLA